MLEKNKCVVCGCNVCYNGRCKALGALHGIQILPTVKVVMSILFRRFGMKTVKMESVVKEVAMIRYLDLVNNLMKHPRDISTKPVTNKAGKWFYAYVENGKVFVDVARKHTPTCSISKPRVLLEKEIEDIYELYIRRKQGHAVSKQAADVTRNQVYWYGIFSDMGL